MMAIQLASLVGVHPELDALLGELGFFGNVYHNLGFAPGNGGDISVLIPMKVQDEIFAGDYEGPEIRFDDILRLAELRSDRGAYYRAEAVSEDSISNADLALLDGRLVLATVSGGKIWDLGRNPERNLCLLLVSAARYSFRIVFGHGQFGTVPTTEFVNHLVAHASNRAAGLTNSAVVHLHPQELIDLSRHRAVQGKKDFNYMLYGQRPELLANVPDGIGYVPYLPPGSTGLVEQTREEIFQHRVVMWQRHGILVREHSLERCSDLVEYVNASAAAALRDLMLGGDLASISIEEMKDFVSRYSLPDTVVHMLAS